MSSNNFLSSVTKEELTDWLKGISEKPFRAKQILDWIYKKWVTDPADMANIPVRLREKIRDSFVCGKTQIVKSESSADGTSKHLIRLYDNETVEAVVIPARDGRKTFCISTQVGCPVRCRFCASGADGLIRNLEEAEIIEQVLLLSSYINRLPDNIVVMGMGEGLLNYSNLVAALDKICSPDYIGLGARRITVSTSGIVKNIIKLADEGRQWNLALSLHAVNDRIRSEIIPISATYKIDEILKACDYYFRKTGRQLTFEYVLISGVNDSPDDAVKLAEIAEKHSAKLNIIPYNEVETNSYKRPTAAATAKFRSILERAGVPFTMRIEKGDKINAACGQLRRKSL